MSPSTMLGIKRVLIFSLAYYPHVGGAEVAIKEITDRILDIEFHMITLRLSSHLPAVEKVGNVQVHRIGFASAGRLNKFLFQFLAAWTALQLHREYRFSAAWAMMAHSCGVPATLFNIFRPEVPYALTLQEGDAPEYVERTMAPLWPLFSRAFKRAAAVQAISTFLGQWARRRGFQGPLEIVPNAVDVARFSREYTAGEIDEIKDTLGKRMGDVFLITTSRLVHKNAVDDVIRALPHIPPHVRFVVLGTGPDEASLKKLAAEHKVSERVQFVGHVQHTDLPKYLRACDIFIRASRSEGMGNSFVEAMAAGLPVIATQEGGIADFLFDPDRKAQSASYGAGEKRKDGHGANTLEYKTGWAVDKDSPEQIAVQVKNIMEHPEKVRAVVRTAKEMVVEKYDWNIVAKDMHDKVFVPLVGRG